MNILIGILTVLSVLIGILLIVVVTMQTPKSEGFGGVSNAQGNSNFRGKAGYDEMLSGYTRIIAITWGVLAFLLAVFSEVAGRNA